MLGRNGPSLQMTIRNTFSQTTRMAFIVCIKMEKGTVFARSSSRILAKFPDPKLRGSFD